MVSQSKNGFPKYGFSIISRFPEDFSIISRFPYIGYKTLATISVDYIFKYLSNKRTFGKKGLKKKCYTIVYEC